MTALKAIRIKGHLRNCGHGKRTIPSKTQRESPDEFLDSISLRGPLFRGREGAGSSRDQIDVVVFRGHADVKFELVPTAFRPDGPLAHLARQKPTTAAEQIRAEAYLLRRFFSMSDSSGLSLPEDSQALRTHISIVSRYDYPNSLNAEKRVWPPSELLSLLAIGQHYGLPTRLLDWTRSPFTAAYFAAAGASERSASLSWQQLNENEGDRFSVWAFEYTRYLGYQTGAGYGVLNEYRPVAPSTELVSAPHASNPNLHAQDGVFTLFRPEKIELESEIDRTPLDVQTEQTLAMKADRTIFYEITLHIAHARSLLWLLGKEGVTAAKLFPGYGGVVKALFDE